MRIDNYEQYSSVDFGYSATRGKITISNVSTADTDFILMNMHRNFHPSDLLLKNMRHNDMTDLVQIKKVIFNNPATIVLWADGTKTVVKRQKGDRYDKEKGLAMCIAKKALGNQGNYCNVFKEWL